MCVHRAKCMRNFTSHVWERGVCLHVPDRIRSMPLLCITLVNTISILSKHFSRKQLVGDFLLNYDCFISIPKNASLPPFLWWCQLGSLLGSPRYPLLISRVFLRITAGFQEFKLLERLGEGKKPTAIIGEVADDMNLDLVVMSMEAVHSKHVDANLLAEFIPCPVLLLPL